MSLALENITNSQFPDLFQSALVQPLGLNSTFYSQPPSTSSGVIPGNTSVSGWEGFLYDGTPGGGYYSSSHDLAAIGRSILNSTLISPATTRTWMKPRTMTSNPNYNIGAVWQIVPAPTKRISYLYTKDGDVGHYATYLVLMPDYGTFCPSASNTDQRLRFHPRFGSLPPLANFPALIADSTHHRHRLHRTQRLNNWRSPFRQVRIVQHPRYRLCTRRRGRHQTTRRSDLPRHIPRCQQQQHLGRQRHRRRPRSSADHLDHQWNRHKTRIDRVSCFTECCLFIRWWQHERTI